MTHLKDFIEMHQKEIEQRAEILYDRILDMELETKKVVDPAEVYAKALEQAEQEFCEEHEV